MDLKYLDYDETPDRDYVYNFSFSMFNAADDLIQKFLDRFTSTYYVLMPNDPNFAKEQHIIPCIDHPDSYIRFTEKFQNWLNMIGKESVDWQAEMYYGNLSLYIRFKEKRHAMMFKLAWT